VGEQGEAAPHFTFAALYRLRQWRKGQISEVLTHNRNLPSTVNASELFR